MFEESRTGFNSLFERKNTLSPHFNFLCLVVNVFILTQNNIFFWKTTFKYHHVYVIDMMSLFNLKFTTINTPNSVLFLGFVWNLSENTTLCERNFMSDVSSVFYWLVSVFAADVASVRSCTNQPMSPDQRWEGSQSALWPLNSAECDTCKQQQSTVFPQRRFTGGPQPITKLYQQHTSLQLVMTQLLHHVFIFLFVCWDQIGPKSFRNAEILFLFLFSSEIIPVWKFINGKNVLWEILMKLKKLRFQ